MTGELGRPAAGWIFVTATIATVMIALSSARASDRSAAVTVCWGADGAPIQTNSVSASTAVALSTDVLFTNGPSFFACTNLLANTWTNQSTGIQPSPPTNSQAFSPSNPAVFYRLKTDGR